MSESWPTCVVDTNILFDMREGGVLPDMFRLPVHWVTPDLIIAENLDAAEAAMLAGYGLQSVALSVNQVSGVAALRVRYRRPSTNDLAALVLAQAMSITLVTGDNHLRDAANTEKVEVHGALWLLDEMVVASVLPPGQAADALERMLVAGRRLPIQEAAARISRWRGTAKD